MHHTFSTLFFLIIDIIHVGGISCKDEDIFIHGECVIGGGRELANMNGSLILEKPISFFPIDATTVKINFVLSGDPRQFTWDESGIFEVSSPPEKPQRVGSFQTEPGAGELITIRARLNPCISTSVFIKMETRRFEDKYSKTFHYDSSLAVCSNGSFVSSVASYSRNQFLVGTELAAALLLAVILLVVFVACCYCKRAKMFNNCCNKRVRSVERCGDDDDEPYIVSQLVDRNSNYATLT